MRSLTRPRRLTHARRSPRPCPLFTTQDRAGRLRRPERRSESHWQRVSLLGLHLLFRCRGGRAYCLLAALLLHVLASLCALAPSFSAESPPSLSLPAKRNSNAFAAARENQSIISVSKYGQGMRLSTDNRQGLAYQQAQSAVSSSLIGSGTAHQATDEAANSAWESASASQSHTWGGP
jgi:hypothetical protein